jgi:type IV pilus biogenesis/stability protein PilW
MRIRTTVLSMLMAAALNGPAAIADAPPRVAPPDDGRCALSPQWRATPASDSALAELHAKDDVYPEEGVHEEIRPQLGRLHGVLLRAPAATADLAALLAPGFAGSALKPGAERTIKKIGGLEINRATASGNAAALDAKAFAQDLSSWLSDFKHVEAADLDATQVALHGDSAADLDLDFDVTGTGRTTGRLQKLGHWRQSWQRGADGQWRLTRWTAVDETRSQASSPMFVEASESALGSNDSYARQLRHGADHWRQTVDAVLAPDVSSHSGVAAGDVDGDGLDDVYVSQPSGLPNRLFRNQGDGTFKDITDEAGVGVLDASPMALFADVDNDGDQDLAVLTWTQPLLFLNDGQGHFTQKRGAFKFEEPLQGTLIAAAMADYDRDGALDFYLCTYNYFVGKSEASLPNPYHDAQNGPPNVLLRGDGHGNFLDVTKGSGLDANNNRLSLAPAWADYDGDGWIDLVVANDFGRKNLYHSLGLVDGRVRFEDVTAKAGVEDIGAGMSSAWLDYDNDGRLDLYVANMWMAAGLRLSALPGFQAQASPAVRAQFRHHAQGNSLFRNRGDGTFEDATAASGTAKGRWAWASDALDFDNDGWEDLYVTNGMITNPRPDPALGDLDSFYWRRVIGQSPLTRRSLPAFEDSWTALIKLLRARGAQAPHERNVFFHNDGDGTFTNVEGALGLDVDHDARAIAISDYDQDGDLDVFVKSRGGPQLRYFRNDAAFGNASVAFRLIGDKSNRDAIGAIVRVETERGQHTKVVQCGSGYLSQRSHELLFGLGDAKEIRRVTVHWPSGLVQEIAGVLPRQRVTVTEGQAQITAAAFRAALPSAPPSVSPAAAPSPETLVAGTWLYERYPAPDFSLADLGGKEHALSETAGRPLLLHFWSVDCAPCVEGLRTLSRAAAELEGTGATLWTIEVGGPAANARAAALAQKERITVPILTADAEGDVVGMYSVLNRYLFDYAEDLSVPTTLLIDARGQIAKVYRGAAAPATLAADVRDLETAPERELARALPFAGSFLSPVKARPDFQIGMELYGRGFESTALAAFERAAQNAPDAYTHYNLGTLYMKRGERARAELSLERALARQPDYPEARNSLGVILAERGELDRAVESFQAALKSRPDFADAMNNLGYTLLQADQSEPAVKLFEQALVAQPDFPEAYNNLGIYYGQEGDLERAAAHFQKAIEQRPAYGEAVNNLAMVYGATGRGAQAIELLERCLARDPTFEMTYVVLARVLAQEGRREEALKVLERVLQRNAKNGPALELLSQLR